MNIVAKFIKALNSDASPWQIAFAVMFALIVGLTPFWRLHNLIILCLVLGFRVNLGSFVAALTLFSGLAYLFDPAMIGVGEGLLTSESLQPFWTQLYANNLARLGQFNHTLTLGSLSVSLLLAPFVLIATRFLVGQYRNRLRAWVNRLRIARLLKASGVYRWYQALAD